MNTIDRIRSGFEDGTGFGCGTGKGHGYTSGYGEDNFAGSCYFKDQPSIKIIKMIKEKNMKELLLIKRGYEL